MRKVSELTRDALNALVHECVVRKKAIALPTSTGKVGIDQIHAGNWIAWNAKAEEIKRFAKAAKHDLLARQMRGGSYEGDVGRVAIGGKRFCLYPKCGCLVREDFVVWAESPKNWDSVLTPTGKIRESTKPLTTGEVKVDELLHIWKDIRGRAMKMQTPTKLMMDGEWNPVFDMKRTLAQYSAQIADAAKHDCFFPVSKVQADILAGLIAYRERNYADSIDFFLDMGATAVRIARWIQERHGAEAKAKKESEAK